MFAKTWLSLPCSRRYSAELSSTSSLWMRQMNAWSNMAQRSTYRARKSLDSGICLKARLSYWPQLSDPTSRTFCSTFLAYISANSFSLKTWSKISKHSLASSSQTIEYCDRRRFTSKHSIPQLSKKAPMILWSCLWIHSKKSTRLRLTARKILSQSSPSRKTWRWRHLSTSFEVGQKVWS